jgi:hypothetical protein
MFFSLYFIGKNELQKDITSYGVTEREKRREESVAREFTV